MEQYNLSTDINLNKIFIINRSEIEGRWDAMFYDPKFKPLSDRGFVHLKDLTRYIIHPPEYPRNFSENGVQLIRSQNVRPLGISICENPVYFSFDFLQGKKVIKPSIGDVLVVRSGVNAGDTAVIEDDSIDAIIGADTLLCKCNDTIIPKFLQVYFFTNFGKSQMGRHTTGATNKHLNSDNLGKVLVPLMDTVEQKACIEIYERELYRKLQKESEADVLLKSIDSYMLGELGITLPQQDISLKGRIFTTQFSEVVGNRIDPKLYDNNTQSLWRAIRNTHFHTSKLRDLIIHSVSGDWGEEETSDEYYTKCLVIRATEFDNDYNLNLDNTRVKHRFIRNDKLVKMDMRAGDLLIEKSGGSPDQPVGRIAIVNQDYLTDNRLAFSNFIHKIRVNTELINPEYLFCFLKTMHSIKLTDAMQSQTNGIRNLIMSNYFNQYIPLPTLEKQSEIAKHIRSIRTQASSLQREAQEILEKANKEVEQIILGE